MIQGKLAVKAKGNKNAALPETFTVIFTNIAAVYGYRRASQKVPLPDDMRDGRASKAFSG
jgi:hypothetical protein